MLPGFRFRKSFRLFPGLRLNLSKSGVSTSIGKKGATVNLSSKGSRGTVGLPGTGLSYSRYRKGGRGFYLFLFAVLAIYLLYVIFAAQN